MRRCDLLCFVTVLLLLFAQQVALTHAAWHALEHGSEQSQHRDDASIQGDLCTLHGAFAQVLGGVQSDAQQVSSAADVAPVFVHDSGAFFVLEPHLPLSRGPPRFS